MSLKDIFKQQSKGMESLATTGVIGMHMVSGPLVGFAIGYGLDAWLGTGPWLKLVFLVMGIIAGFMNVYEDTRRLLRKMSREEEQKRAEALADRPERATLKKKTVVPDSIRRRQPGDRRQGPRGAAAQRHDRPGSPRGRRHEDRRSRPQ